MLTGDSHSHAIACLDEFIGRHAEREMPHPLERAILQRDVWAIFEYEADIFGPNSVRQPDGTTAVPALKLGECRSSSPARSRLPFLRSPSGRTRIQAAMGWKAENPGSAMP